ncbi:MAG: hypothetical protein EPO68_06600 [Planctomycetota bacterium]|nr:MAG: hypothetical protein EPO68_06600 [Planctomycetota bacterium]
MQRNTHFTPRRLLARAAILAVGLSIAFASGCHEDSDDDETNFNGFVLNLFDDTSDTAPPTPINGKDFKFKENQAVFAELFD